jgi:Calcineurin-like phosphoesterase
LLAEVLNRDFVLQAMRDGLADLTAPDHERRGEPSPIEAELQPGDLEHAQRVLNDALRREEEGTSGQVDSQPDGQERRGANDASLDDAVFISNDREVALFQSALEEYYETQHADVVTPVDDDPRGEADLPPVTDETLGAVDDVRRLSGRFEPTDIRWVNCLFAKAVRTARGRHAFKDEPAAVTFVKPRFRLVVVGDWGTGLPRAGRVAEQMRAEIEKGKEEGVEQHVVHLGDVYYSGWKREYEKRFLSLWPVASEDAGDIASWCLNGNHDMYSGGGGLFDFLLAQPAFARQQQSTWFSIENNDWKILGLDTAYEDHALRGSQAAWVADKLAEGSHCILLLSHHQLFSTDPTKGSPKLQQALGGTLDSGRITSWFWGHEHRCAVYAPHLGVKLASCIGHGGVPVYETHAVGDPPREPAKYEYFESFVTGVERWAVLGFAVLEFDGSSLAVRYIDEFGNEHHSEALA